MYPNWSSLPEELLSLIIKRIDIPIDYFSFRGVCKSWRSVAMIDCNVLLPQPPWLILPLPEYADDKEEVNFPTRRAFLGLSQPTRIYQLDLHEPHQNSCVGSVGTWLVTLDTNHKVCLLNFLTGLRINLPSLTTIMGNVDDDGSFAYLTKVVISSSPSEQNLRDCMAMGIFVSKKWGDGLIFARPDDRSWTILESENPWKRQFGSFEDLIFFNNAFYGISFLGYLVVCDINGPQPPTISLLMPISKHFFSFGTNCYLVELLGELLLVFKVVDYSTEEKGDNSISRPTSFTVYKLNLITKRIEEVKSLGQYSLFLGRNASMSLLAFDSSIWRRNCIYFTYDNFIYSHEHGVFDLEDGNVRRYSCMGFSYVCSPSLWAIPKSMINRIPI